MSFHEAGSSEEAAGCKCSILLDDLCGNHIGGQFIAVEPFGVFSDLDVSPPSFDIFSGVQRTGFVFAPLN